MYTSSKVKQLQTNSTSSNHFTSFKCEFFNPHYEGRIFVSTVELTRVIHDTIPAVKTLKHVERNVRLVNIHHKNVS